MKEFYQNYKKVLITGGISLAVVFVALFVAGASFGNSDGINVAQNGFAQLSVSKSVEVVGESTSFAKRSILSPSPELPSVQGGDISDKKVIKNARLSVVVRKIDDAISSIKDITKSAGGFVENSSVYETGNDRKGGNITVRVPSDALNSSMDAIKKVVIKVSREDVSARDVTEQFVDIKVRLKNMKAEEKQYLEIMKRAVKIEDVLNVAQRLGEVRSRIERLEGQLNYLSRQVDMSTITVSLTSEADVEVFGIVWSPVAQIKQGVRDMLQSIVNFINGIIAFAFKLPIFILWFIVFAVLLWGGWKGVLTAKRKISNRLKNIN